MQVQAGAGVKRDDIAKRSLLTLYKENVRGIITASSSSIDTGALTHIGAAQGATQGERRRPHAHPQGAGAFEQARRAQVVRGRDHHEDECVVCYEPPGKNHVWLCPQCAEESFPAPVQGQQCLLVISTEEYCAALRLIALKKYRFVSMHHSCSCATNLNLMCLKLCTTNQMDPTRD